MGFFSIFRKKNDSNELELTYLPNIPEEEIVIDSPDIVPLSSGNVIDTTSRENIAKYKHNVELIRQRVKETGDIGNLVIIRNDDILPMDFVWRENSSDTYYEKILPSFGYELRNYIVDSNSPKVGDFFIPMSREEKSAALKKLPKDLGKLIVPVKFRTTKHFTMNTPLGYTGSYNLVNAERKYTVIDDASLLINSPYTYTISGRDSYLDVTHEGLPISMSAIILISEDYFNEIKDNKELMDTLLQRNLIVYKGNIDTAINMLLSERGILPFRPGERIEYDSEIEAIIESNLKAICYLHGYRYEVGHGNMNGTGGHFSDLIDDEVNYIDNSLTPFTDFLNLNAGLDYEIYNTMLSSSDYVFKIIKDIGVDKLLSLIESYNKYMTSVMNNRLSSYANNRDNISSEESELFSNTVRRIDMFFRTNTPKEDSILWEMIIHFYMETSVDKQIEYANSINERLNAIERM